LIDTCFAASILLIFAAIIAELMVLHAESDALFALPIFPDATPLTQRFTARTQRGASHILAEGCRFRCAMMDTLMPLIRFRHYCH
jgi:hypothetical protein